MLAVLFVISACYQFASCGYDLLKLVSDDPTYTPGVCAIAFLLNLTLAVLSCVAVSLGGTFAFVLGIIFAVISFFGLAVKFIGCSNGADGCFDVLNLLYSLTMMVLFIIAVCIV